MSYSFDYREWVDEYKQQYYDNMIKNLQDGAMAATLHRMTYGDTEIEIDKTTGECTISVPRPVERIGLRLVVAAPPVIRNYFDYTVAGFPQLGCPLDTRGLR